MRAALDVVPPNGGYCLHWGPLLTDQQIVRANNKPTNTNPTNRPNKPVPCLACVTREHDVAFAPDGRAALLCGPVGPGQRALHVRARLGEATGYPNNIN